MENKSDDGDDRNQDLDGNDPPSGEATGTKRRRRGDAGERNYTCGCGKSYLSYPALYTHIKTKHNGVTPGGTSQPQGNGKSGRGRPKKEESGNKIKEEDRADNLTSYDSQAANETVIDYFKTLGTKISYDEQEGNKNACVTDQPDNFDLVANFPTNLLRPEEFNTVLKELDTLCKNKTIGPEELDKDTALKRTNMNKIFAVFIYHIGRHLTERFYKEFVYFLMMYRKALNEIGWVIKAEVMQQGIPDSEKRVEFCAINNGEYAPDISNDFITEKWPDYVPNYNLSEFKIVGGDPEMTKNVVLLTQSFCNWLNAQKYTNSKLQLNDENE